MNSFVVLFALVASAAAGGQFGYSTAQGTTHAVGVSAVHAAPAVAYAAGPAYGYQQVGLGVAGYGIAQPAVYAAPAPVVKTVAPVAQSTAFVNRAPAARLAVAAAPVAVAQPALLAQPGLIRSGVVAGPAVGLGGLGVAGYGVAGQAYL